MYSASRVEYKLHVPIRGIHIYSCTFLTRFIQNEFQSKDTLPLKYLYDPTNFVFLNIKFFKVFSNFSTLKRHVQVLNFLILHNYPTVSKAFVTLKTISKVIFTILLEKLG